VTGSLVYVYAVLTAAGGALEGIDDAPVRYVSEGDLIAAVSDVPSEDFDEEPLNERVRDMSWLAPRAVAHQDVNYRLHAQADSLIPLAFGTVFRDDDRVRQMLQTGADALQARLAAVGGAAEWVVTLHLLKDPEPDEVAASSPALQALRAEVAASSPGKAHLLRRRLVELEREEARREQAEVSDQVLQQLQQVARGVYREALPTDTLERPLLRASVLVARMAEAAFVGEVERLRRRFREPMYRVALTGPWPPYRFGGLEADDG
jgi:hypothetical protein